MNRLQKRASISNDLQRSGVPSVCQDLHELTTGSSEDSLGQKELCIDFLQRVLDTWELPQSDYDLIVKSLILQTLHDAGRRPGDEA